MCLQCFIILTMRMHGLLGDRSKPLASSSTNNTDLRVLTSYFQVHAVVITIMIVKFTYMYMEELAIPFV